MACWRDRNIILFGLILCVAALSVPSMALPAAADDSGLVLRVSRAEDRVHELSKVAAQYRMTEAELAVQLSLFRRQAKLVPDLKKAQRNLVLLGGKADLPSGMKLIQKLRADTAALQSALNSWNGAVGKARGLADKICEQARKASSASKPSPVLVVGWRQKGQRRVEEAAQEIGLLRRELNHAWRKLVSSKKLFQSHQARLEALQSHKDLFRSTLEFLSKGVTKLPEVKKSHQNAVELKQKLVSLRLKFGVGNIKGLMEELFLLYAMAEGSDDQPGSLKSRVDAAIKLLDLISLPNELPKVPSLDPALDQLTNLARHFDLSGWQESRAMMATSRWRQRWAMPPSGAKASGGFSGRTWSKPKRRANGWNRWRVPCAPI